MISVESAVKMNIIMYHYLQKLRRVSPTYKYTPVAISDVTVSDKGTGNFFECIHHEELLQSFEDYQASVKSRYCHHMDWSRHFSLVSADFSSRMTPPSLSRDNSCIIGARTILNFRV